MFNWRTYLTGLLAAVINGAAGAIALVVVDPLTFNIQEGLPKLLTAAAVSGILSAANYLKQPFPFQSDK